MRRGGFWTGITLWTRGCFWCCCKYLIRRQGLESGIFFPLGEVANGCRILTALTSVSYLEEVEQTTWAGRMEVEAEIMQMEKKEMERKGDDCHV
jgi:hypothetical protein